MHSLSLLCNTLKFTSLKTTSITTGRISILRLNYRRLIKYSDWITQSSIQIPITSAADEKQQNVNRAKHNMHTLH